MSMLPVAFDRLRNTLQCRCPIKEISHDNGFLFQSLVILEEAFNFTHAMGRQFKNRVIVRIIGIVYRVDRKSGIAPYSYRNPDSIHYRPWRHSDDGASNEGRSRGISNQAVSRSRPARCDSSGVGTRPQHSPTARSISSGRNSSRSRRSASPSSASRMPASGAPSARGREQDGYGRGCVLALAPSRRLYLVRERAARGECCDAREGRVQDRAQGFAREECLMPRHDHVRE